MSLGSWHIVGGTSLFIVQNKYFRILNYTFFLIQVCTDKQDPKEEFSDWSQGLLAIGTFGNTDLTRKQESQTVQNSELEEFTPEDFGKLQSELTELLSKKQAEEQISDLSLDRFLNCPSISNRYGTNSDDKDEEIERTIRKFLGRYKDVRENKKTTIGKKSVSFLLKKMFVCTSGSVPNPGLRDTFHESRMEKVIMHFMNQEFGR